MESMASKNLADFAGVLAARQSVPGGGGAAAYAGALAAALCSMAGEFTAGKPRYRDVEDDVQRMLVEAERARKRLVELVDEDAAAFRSFSEIHALPKEDPVRSEKMEQATKEIIKVPLEVMRQCARAVGLLEEMGEKCSPLLLSDVGSGALLARAALEAASLDVFVNTRTLRDRAFAQAAEKRCDGLLAEYVPRAEAVEKKVMDHIRRRS